MFQNLQFGDEMTQLLVSLTANLMIVSSNALLWHNVYLNNPVQKVEHHQLASP